MRIADNSLRPNYIISATTSRTVSVNDQAAAPAVNDVTWMMSSSVDDEKATAKARLQAAKDLLETLERWSFPPNVIARTAAALGKSVASAAADFSASSTVGGQPAESIAESIQTVVPEMASENKGLESAGEIQDKESRWNALPRAYTSGPGV